MKTKLNLDCRVKAYLKKAEEKSNLIRKIRVITSDVLLVAVLEDNDSKLRSFFESQGYVTEYFEEELTISEFYSEELIKNFYTSKKENDKYSEEVKEILNFAQNLADQKGTHLIDEDALSVALVQNENPFWKVIYEYEGINSEDITKYFSAEKYLKSQIVKGKWGKTITKIAFLDGSDEDETNCEGMLELLNDKFEETGPNVILKRDSEIQKALTIFQKMTTRNVILVGEPGVGKTAIVEGITERIVKGKCPREFRNKRVMSLNINALLEDIKYLGQREERFNALKEYLEENTDVILFIDEIHNIIGAGKTEGGSYDLANALKPILTNGEVRIIGATTEEEYNKYFSSDGALKRRFQLVEVKEPKTKDLYRMLEGKIHQLEEYHGVAVSKEAFETVVSEASGYRFDVANPARTIDLLDTAMVFAKNSRKKELDVKSILKVHEENIKKYRKMNKKDLMSTAYHEAGHYILYRTLNSKWKDVTLVSIIPADDYLGVNVFEEKEGYCTKGREEYLNNIAEYLAGDLASELKGYAKNSGKRGDLEIATEIARNMVLLYGMSEQDNKTILGSYNSFSCKDGIELEYLSDAQKEELARQTDKILEIASGITRQVLKNKEKQLDIIAEALFKRGSLNKKEIDALYSGRLKLENLAESNISLIK